MCRQSTVAVIKDLVKHGGVKIFAHWIREHIDYPGNGRTNILEKAAIALSRIDVYLS